MTSCKMVRTDIQLSEAKPQVVILPDCIDTSSMALELVHDIEVFNPCSRAIEAIHRAETRVSIEFSVEKFTIHRARFKLLNLFRMNLACDGTSESPSR